MSEHVYFMIAAVDIEKFAESVKGSFLSLIGMDENTLKNYINKLIESSG